MILAVCYRIINRYVSYMSNGIKTNTVSFHNVDILRLRLITEY